MGRIGRRAGWNARVCPMDIIASMLGYLVCMTGLVTGLVMSAVIFFSLPNQDAQIASGATAMVVRPSAGSRAGLSAGLSSGAAIKEFPVKEFPVKTIARSQQKDERNPAAVAAASAAQAAVAQDVPQKPIVSTSRTRRWAEKERARQIASRERSSFEARFLHYDD